MAEKLPQVDVSDDILMRIMRNPNFTAAFPFLGTTISRATAPKGLGCGGCAKKNRTRQVDLNLVRRQLSELAPTQKAKLKQLFNTRQVVIRYLKPNGQKIKIKF